MLRRLIILLLIVGCENFFKEEGICVRKNMETNSNHCYPTTTESQCKDDVRNNKSFILIYWGQNYDCNEFCNSQIPDEICEIH